MGLNVAGVDLLRSNHGPVVMEVNSSPGLEGIETATEIDVAGGDHSSFWKRKRPPARPKTASAADAGVHNYLLCAVERAEAALHDEEDRLMPDRCEAAGRHRWAAFLTLPNRRG